MIDYQELMALLSIPRPNGSRAEQETRRHLQDWLHRRNIPHRTHTFRLHPYFFEPIGLWLIVTRSLLAAAIWLRWGWPALVIALLSLPGGILDVLGYPLITGLGARPGQNLLIEFNPDSARQEILLTAHYDSKTELLDHRQRMFFLLHLPHGIALTILLGLLGPLDRLLLAQGSSLAGYSYAAGVILTLPLLFLAWGLGLNLTLGRFRPPSQGAVDNGAACAILLGLAERIARGELALQQTRVTLALFTGEEVNMQGSRAYARSRVWPVPAVAVNLEVMAQDGEYVYWEKDGSSLKLVPCSPDLGAALADTVAQVTGQPARPAGPVNSDGGSFLQVGIPATTLGTYDSVWRDRGFHRPTDNLGRVVLDRLPEGVEILARFIERCDRGEVQLWN